MACQSNTATKLPSSSSLSSTSPSSSSLSLGRLSELFFFSLGLANQMKASSSAPSTAPPSPNTILAGEYGSDREAAPKVIHGAQSFRRLPTEGHEQVKRVEPSVERGGEKGIAMASSTSGRGDHMHALQWRCAVRPTDIINRRAWASETAQLDCVLGSSTVLLGATPPDAATLLFLVLFSPATSKALSCSPRPGWYQPPTNWSLLLPALFHLLPLRSSNG